MFDTTQAPDKTMNLAEIKSEYDEYVTQKLKEDTRRIAKQHEQRNARVENTNSILEQCGLGEHTVKEFTYSRSLRIGGYAISLVDQESRVIASRYRVPDDAAWISIAENIYKVERENPSLYRKICSAIDYYHGILESDRQLKRFLKETKQLSELVT